MQKMLLVSILMCGWAVGADVELHREGEKVAVTIDGKLFTTYYLGGAAAKAYLMPLQSAKGLVISRPFPVENDVSAGDPKASSFEPHQRPLYFAHGNVDGYNFWAEPQFQKYYGDSSRQSYGHMTDGRIEKIFSSGNAGTLEASFTLSNMEGRSLGRETQTFVFSGTDNQRLIDCDFILRATDGPLDLGDTKEGTFGIRLGAELSAPLGHMRNSHGSEGEKAVWGQPADWVNYSGMVASQPVGIVVFDHPKSFRHPTTWHARGYGLLAANPFGAREFTANPSKDGSWTIPEGGTLEFKYRVIIYDGIMTTEQIQTAYERYAAH